MHMRLYSIHGQIKMHSWPRPHGHTTMCTCIHTCQGTFTCTQPSACGYRASASDDTWNRIFMYLKADSALWSTVQKQIPHTPAHMLDIVKFSALCPSLNSAQQHTAHYQLQHCDTDAGNNFQSRISRGIQSCMYTMRIQDMNVGLCYKTSTYRTAKYKTAKNMMANHKRQNNKTQNNKTAKEHNVERNKRQKTKCRITERRKLQKVEKRKVKQIKFFSFFISLQTPMLTIYLGLSRAGHPSIL